MTLKQLYDQVIQDAKSGSQVSVAQLITVTQAMQAQGAGILQESKFTMMGERNRVPEYPSKYFKARW